jgi:hypothetical protein
VRYSHGASFINLVQITVTGDRLQGMFQTGRGHTLARPFSDLGYTLDRMKSDLGFCLK